jgi:PilZ domain
MQEHRARSRHRTLKAGTISFNRAGAISCTVRNLSETGACLEVTSPLGIPDDFTLVIAHDHLQRSCHVAWRAPNRIGVEFK